MAPVLGYWDIRGLGEPIRTLLHYVGVDFEDKRYNFGPAPDFSLQHWLDDKEKLGLKFPNLPYYIDGDIKITQTVAIIRYLAKKHGLQPTNEQDEIEANTLEQITRDIMYELIRHAYYPAPPEDVREFMAKKVFYAVKGVADALGDKQWLVGDKISYVDFLMVECLDQLIYLHPTIVKEYPNIVAYIERFEALPGIKKYRESREYKAWPFYSPFAHWSGAGDAPKREF